MFTIENEGKRVDWQAIKAEYIGSQISYRDLAKKHGVAFGSLRYRAQTEQWVKLREYAVHESGMVSAQKAAEAAADNAVIAADLKKRLLLRLKRIEENYPDDATEVRTRHGNNYAIFRIRDLCAAYKDLTEDLTKAGDTDKNSPVMELLRRLDGECSVQ